MIRGHPPLAGRDDSTGAGCNLPLHQPSRPLLPRAPEVGIFLVNRTTQRRRSVFARINHVAIVSEKYSLLAAFYQSLFGMTTAPKARTNRAITVGDGYVGLNINPRKAGRPAGLDHFGVEVEEVETVFDRMRTKYPQADWVQRPSTRPFAGITANDPDGNIFDLSQKQMANRSGVYVDNEASPQHERHI